MAPAEATRSRVITS